VLRLRREALADGVGRKGCERVTVATVLFAVGEHAGPTTWAVEKRGSST
jgi:hypothetical protein